MNPRHMSLHGNVQIKHSLPRPNLLETITDLSLYVDIPNEIKLDSPKPYNLEPTSNISLLSDNEKEIKRDSPIINTLECIPAMSVRMESKKEIVCNSQLLKNLEYVPYMSLFEEVKNKNVRDFPMLNDLESLPAMSLDVDVKKKIICYSPKINGLEFFPAKSLHVKNESQHHSIIQSNLESITDMTLKNAVKNEGESQKLNNLGKTPNMTVRVDEKNEIERDSAIFSLESAYCQSLQHDETISSDAHNTKINIKKELLIMTENARQILKNLNVQSTKLIDMQLKKTFKILNISKEDMEDFIEETNHIFLKYNEAYNKLLVFLENLFQNIKNKRIKTYVQKNFEEYLLVYYSIFEEDLTSYVSIFDSSKKHFEEFNISLQNDLEICCQDCDKTFSSIKGTINKGSIACLELISVSTKLANYE